MAVTDVSGTAGGSALASKICQDASQAPWFGGHGHSDNKRPLLQGEHLGVYFLIKSGLTSLTEVRYPSYCTRRCVFFFMSCAPNLNHNCSQQIIAYVTPNNEELYIEKSKRDEPTSIQDQNRTCKSALLAKFSTWIPIAEVEGLNSTNHPQRHVVKDVFVTKSPSWTHNPSRD